MINSALDIPEMVAQLYRCFALVVDLVAVSPETFWDVHDVTIGE